jgi:sterol desaturase/sphingolipid hydroxylase (fatty acid hydroxylase superfamily)
MQFLAAFKEPKINRDEETLAVEDDFLLWQFLHQASPSAIQEQLPFASAFIAKVMRFMPTLYISIMCAVVKKVVTNSLTIYYGLEVFLFTLIIDLPIVIKHLVIHQIYLIRKDLF